MAFSPRYLGIMEGRLLPPTPGRFQCFPRERWAEEFAAAREAGLQSIEWIYDLHGADVNPLGTDTGIAELKRLSDATGVRVVSVCADWFMDRPLLRASTAEASERFARLLWLVTRCSKAGIERVVLPFVDASRMDGEAERAQVVKLLREALPAAERDRVELHLETDLDPAAFAGLLARVPHPMVRVNYDSGNSASLGYHPREELSAYGDRLGSVHLKDRVRGGGTVPLGTGDADLPGLFTELRRLGYRGDLVLQVARGAPGDEVAWARRNRAQVEKLAGGHA